MKSTKNPDGHFIDRDQFQRALELRACSQILQILERNQRCMAAWDEYRRSSQTTKCDLTSADWKIERRSELDDAFSYEVLNAMLEDYNAR